MDIFSVNTRGMDPEDHAYHTELPYGPGPGRHWNPDFGYEPSDEDERRSEGVGEDDDSGYNWGPTPNPHHIPEGQMGIFHEPLPDYDVEDPSFGEYDKGINDWEAENGRRAPGGGNEEHRIGALLRQSEQFAFRMAGSGDRPEGWKCPDCGSDHKMVPDYSECPSCGYDEVQSNNLGTCPECDHYEDDWIDDRAPIDHWDDQMWEHDPAEWHVWNKQRSGAVEHSRLAWGDSTPRPKGTHNNALSDGEYFHNLDPALGTTVPEFVDGQPEGAVPIRPMNEAEGSDAFVLKNEQTGLGYDAIVRLSPDGKGFDVLKAL